MSKVVIAGDASGTGTFTISAPNGNTDRTLVLPDEAGTVLTTAGVPASAMPAGSVLQTVYQENNSAVSGTGWVSGIVTATITPHKANSKVVGIFTVTNFYANTDVYARVIVNGVDIAPSLGNSTTGGISTFINLNNSVGIRRRSSVFTKEHFSGSTNAQTWSYALSVSDSSSIHVNYPDNRGVHSITLMEIAV